MLTFQVFATPTVLASGYTDVLGPEDGFTFVSFHDFLLPPTTFCCPRLSAVPHDYLLPPTTPSLRPLGEIPETACPGLLLRRGDRIRGMMNA
jgi:hypothetical protein